MSRISRLMRRRLAVRLGRVDAGLVRLVVDDQDRTGGEKLRAGAAQPASERSQPRAVLLDDRQHALVLRREQRVDVVGRPEVRPRS